MSSHRTTGYVLVRVRFTRETFDIGVISLENLGHTRETSAECSLESNMGVAGQRSRAGQEVRLIDLPVDNNDGRGIVVELHGFEDSRALVDTLFANSQKYYGIALREFLVRLTNSGIDNHLEIVRKLVDQFIRDNQPYGASGQVLRVAERFGLIAAAGELATSMGITGWEQGEATVSISSLFAR